MIRAAILSATAAGVLGGCASLAGNRLPELTQLIARTSPAVVAVGDEKNLLGSRRASGNIGKKQAGQC
jgi:hypothetical protein